MGSYLFQPRVWQCPASITEKIVKQDVNGLAFTTLKWFQWLSKDGSRCYAILQVSVENTASIQLRKFRYLGFYLGVKSSVQKRHISYLFVQKRVFTMHGNACTTLSLVFRSPLQEKSATPPFGLSPFTERKLFVHAKR